jgi:tetratricopeptide (TPR) repeat protein
MAAPKLARILDGYGDGGMPTGSKVPMAQAFFDNGMQLAHAFAHKAASEAMSEAVRLDSTCVTCAWGAAWAAGPTINYGIEGKELKDAQRLAANADRLARAHGTPLERQLTAAIVARYRNGGGGKPGDAAFARAMERIAVDHPQSDELATLAADAVLVGVEREEDWKPAAAKAAAMLEPVLKRNPTHTPAVHFYIHATEEAGDGRKAEPFADSLGARAPKSQHLVHMPSHTYYWVGRYADAARVNRQAVDIGIAQAKAMDSPPPEGVFGLPYHAHNVTFGLGGALMAGDADTALYLGRPLIAAATNPAIESMRRPFSQALAGSGYVALALFADPKEVMATPAPAYPYLRGLWHYARGEALARAGNVAGVRAEAAAIAVPVANEKTEGWGWQAAESLRIARAVLEGRAAMIAGRPSEAAIAFRRAAELEEQPAYGKASDPPLWWFPVRRDLAVALAAAGDVAGARTEAQATLKLRPKDPGATALLARLDGTVAAR